MQVFKYVYLEKTKSQQQLFWRLVLDLAKICVENIFKIATVIRVVSQGEIVVSIITQSNV